MFLGTEFEKTRIDDPRIKLLEPKEETKEDDREEMIIEDELMS